MELEDLKREWQKNDSFKQIVKNSMIMEMLANKSSSALECIKKKERDALKVIPFAIASVVLVSARMIIHGGFGSFWVLLLIPIGALLWYWSYYLCKFLDQINMSTMTVTEVSRHILKYKTYLVRHTIGAAILLPIYLGVWAFQFYKVNHPDGIFDIHSSWIIAYSAIALIAFLIAIWHRFFKPIRTIQNNLKELEDFEKE